MAGRQIVTALSIGSAMLWSFAANAQSASFTTADHSKFKALQGPFKTGPDVTAAWPTCHAVAAERIQKAKRSATRTSSTISASRSRRITRTARATT